MYQLNRNGNTDMIIHCMFCANQMYQLNGNGSTNMIILKKGQSCVNSVKWFLLASIVCFYIVDLDFKFIESNNNNNEIIHK